jgi:RNA polymerase sigma factor (sigma-70 family)
VSPNCYGLFFLLMPPEFSDQSRWFSANLQPHEPMLRAWLRSRFSTGLDLDDVIQEAYLRVFKAHEKKEIKAPKAFLFATARNIALNAIRAATVRGEGQLQQIEDLDVLDEGEDIQETVARNQELETLTVAIQSLPKRCRRIFTLCKVYGMTPKEIASELEISLPTVYTQLSIGLDKCSEYVLSCSKIRSL